MDTNRTHPTTNKAPVIPGFCENSASAVIQIAVIVPTQEIAKRCAGNAMMYMVLLPSTRTRVAGVMEIRTPTNPAMTVHAKEQYVVASQKNWPAAPNELSLAFPIANAIAEVMKRAPTTPIAVSMEISELRTSLAPCSSVNNARK